MIVSRSSTPISQFPNMPKGNMPYDGGNLLLNVIERNDFILKYSEQVKFIRRLVGTREFIDNIEKYW